MGAKLYKQFQEFHDAIKLDKESTPLKEKREMLESDIKSKLPDELETLGISITKSDLNFFDQGSYRQKTSTGIKAGATDRDLAIEFELDKDTYDDPREIKKCVRNALKIENKRDPIIKEPCVTVKYLKKGEENVHIDFPIYAIYNGSHYLARGKATSVKFEWEECDPHGLNDHFDSLFEGEQGNQLRRIVRYLKKWREEKYGSSYTKNQIPPSIGLTLLAGSVFQMKQTDGQDDDLSALLNVCKQIKGKFTKTDDEYEIKCLLPVLPKTDVFYKMTASSKTTFYKKWEKLCEKVQNAVDATEEYEAAKFLQDQFGEDFKLPPEPDTNTGNAKRENSYA